MIVCGIAMVHGCTSSRISKASPPKTASASRIIDTLQESYPNGPPSDVAQMQMEQNGFQCERVTRGNFVHVVRNADGTSQRRTLEGIDFIRCNRTTKNGILVTYFDEVALVIKDDVVVEMLANWDSVGP